MKNLSTHIQESLNESDDDTMSPAEVKDEVLSIIKDLERNANSWSSRDTLTKFTSWGFWSGNEMASIDVKIAKQIAKELHTYAKSLRPGSADLEEIYDAI